MKNKKDCYSCKFREKIIGDAHSKCNNEWNKEDFKGKTKKITATWNQWSTGFPNNFDPHWFKNCKKHQENETN
jgi:hypothetical protein